MSLTCGLCSSLPLNSQDDGEAYEDECPGDWVVLIPKVPDEVTEDAGCDEGGEKLEGAEDMVGEERIWRGFRSGAEEEHGGSRMPPCILRSCKQIFMVGHITASPSLLSKEIERLGKKRM